MENYLYFRKNRPISASVTLGSATQTCPAFSASDIGAGATGAMKSQASFSGEAMYDNGGTFMGGSRMYDTGGPTTEHGMAILQKGETVIPKTQNMLDSGGITLNIGGDIVTDDAEDFAERIAQVIPEALRRQNDIGGI